MPSPVSFQLSADVHVVHLRRFVCPVNLVDVCIRQLIQAWRGLFDTLAVELRLPEPIGIIVPFASSSLPAQEDPDE